jgi:hypothetical protein
VRAGRLSPSARIGGYVYDVSDGTMSEVVSPTEA